MKAFITDCLNRSGFAHLMKSKVSEEEARQLCQDNGWKLDETPAHYTWTILPGDAKASSSTDWERIRKEQHERRQKAAARRKSA
jgi:hypothetical protein